NPPTARRSYRLTPSAGPRERRRMRRTTEATADRAWPRRAAAPRATDVVRQTAPRSPTPIAQGAATGDSSPARLAIRPARVQHATIRTTAPTTRRREPPPPAT